MVLLIACVNVASLMLARAVSREREVAMRVALGARRGRLIRQMLTESLVLSLGGGALGIALAALGLRPFAAFWPGKLARAEEVHLDWSVLAFAIGVSLVCGILFGLAPALRVPKRALEQTLRAGARAVAGGSRRLHGAFVVAEIALAVVLLVSAGILGRTILRVSSLDPGINVKNVLVARMALSPSVTKNPDRMRSAWKEALDRASHVPGVEAVATVDTVPMREGNNQLGYWTSPSMPPRPELPVTIATSVSQDYLKVMRIPLKSGRFFTDQDRLSNELVVVIDEVLAQHAFGRQDPVGKSLWVPDMAKGPVTIVGVTGHVRHWGMAGDDDAQVRDQLYYPFAQVPDTLMKRWSDLTSIAVRTAIDPLTLLEPLKRDLRGATGDQVLYEPRTMEQLAASAPARASRGIPAHAVRGRRGLSFAARVHRHLRSAGLSDQPARARNRSTHGARSKRLGCNVAGARAESSHDRHRHRRRNDRRRRRRPGPRQIRSRRKNRRRSCLRSDDRCPDHRRFSGKLPARPSREQSPSLGRPAHGVDLCVAHAILRAVSAIVPTPSQTSRRVSTRHARLRAPRLRTISPTPSPAAAAS